MIRLRRLPLLLPLLAFGSGIATADAAGPPGLWSVALLTAAVGSVVIAMTGRGRTAGLSVCVVLTAFAAGWAAGGARFADVPPTQGRTLVRVRGIVESSSLEAQSRAFGAHEPTMLTKWSVGLTAMEVHGEWRAAGGEVWVRVSGEGGEPAIVERLPGDAVEFMGWARPIRHARNPGQHDFAAWSARQGVAWTIDTQPGAILDRDEHDEWRWRRIPAAARASLSAGWTDRLGDTRAAYLECFLLGSDGRISPALDEPFTRSGSMHLLAMSGLHLVVLSLIAAQVLRAFAIRPWLRTSILGMAIVLILYLAESRPSLLRSAAVVLVALVHRGSGTARSLFTASVLFGSATAVLAVDPGDLWNPGFTLSFLAYAGLVAVLPGLQQLGSRPLPEFAVHDTRSPLLGAVRAWAGGGLRASAAVFLVTAPLTARVFHIVSPVMLLANLVTIPLLTVVLALALLLPIEALGLPLLSSLPGDLLAIALDLLDRVVVLLGSTPAGYFYVANLAWWAVLWYAAVICAGWAWSRRMSVAPIAEPRRRWPMWAAAAAAVLVVSAAPSSAGPASLLVLDVGGGQCLAVTDGAGGAVLIDAGAKRWPDAGQQVIAPALWSEGVRRIDAVFLSHRDDDHVNGFADLAERFPIGTVIVPVGFDLDESGLRTLAAVRAAGLPIVTVAAGDRAVIAGHTWEVLHPSADILALSPGPNDRSLVLRFPLPGSGPPVHALVPGDIEAAGVAVTARTIRAQAWAHAAADILLAPHHGGPTLAGTAVLTVETGAAVVIASNDRPRTPQVIAGRSGPVEVWETLDYGAIRLTADGGRWRLTPFVPSERPSRR